MPNVLNQRSKRWCFTINNYMPSTVLALRELGRDQEISGYLVFGREGRASGRTPHLQGYVEFLTRKKGSTIKRMSQFTRAHIEPSKGKAPQAADYCKKEGDFEEYGELSDVSQGKRTDLDDIKEKIDAGASALDVAQDHFNQWVVYRRSFAAYRSLIKPPTMRPDLRVYILYGAPGVGKSRYAYYRDPSLYSVPAPDLRWFDGYAGEEVVLIDDYRGAGDPSFLLKLLDIYPLQVPVKGDFVAWNPKKIFMTSNLDPRSWHPEISEPLMRRVHYCMHLEASLNFADGVALRRFDELMP